jgi:hypothetical protein
MPVGFDARLFGYGRVGAEPDGGKAPFIGGSAKILNTPLAVAKVRVGMETA